MRRLLKLFSGFKLPFSFTYQLLAIVLVGLCFAAFFIFFYFKPELKKAANWHLDDNRYRMSVSIGNSGTAATNQKVKIELDTQSLISQNKLQNDCGDIRFFDQSGAMLSYYQGYNLGTTANMRHESNDFSEYTSSNTDAGDLSTSASAAMGGSSYGMAVLIDDTTNIYASKTLSFTSPTLRYRFYFDPNSITIATNDAFYLGGIYVSGSNVVNTHVRWNGSTYQLRAAMDNDAGSSNNGTYFDITDAPHYIEIEVNRATTDSSNDATLEFYIDGVLKETLSGIDLYTQYNAFSNSRWGAVSSIDTGTTGTFYMDEIAISNDGNTIGPVPDACNTSSTDFYVTIPTIVSDTSLIYAYYGNSLIANGSMVALLSVPTFTPTSGPTYGSEETSDAPIAWWKFDEGTDNTCSGGTNDACDSTTSQNDLAKSGASWRTEDMCANGKCLQFDGTDDYLSRTDDADLDFTDSESFTISGWFKRGPKTTGTDTLLVKQAPAAIGTGSTATTTITTSTDAGESTYDASWNNRVVYDPNNDRWHVIYINSSADIHTQSTAATSGTSWTDGIDIDAGTYDYEDFSCAVETDDSTTYMHCAYSTGAADTLLYERCTLSGSAPYISCDTQQTVHDAADANDDVQYPSLTIDSNDCVLIGATYEDASNVSDPMQIYLWQETGTCGDGAWTTGTGNVYTDIQTEAGYSNDGAVGIKSFGGLDAQLFWIDTDSGSAVNMETVYFDGTGFGTQRTLNADVEFGSANKGYDSVVFNNSTVTFATDDTTTDLDGMTTTSKGGDLVSQVDTLLNVPSATANYSGYVTSVVDTVGSGGDNIWVFGMDSTDNTDIYYNTSTNGGSSWSGASTQWVNSADTGHVDYLSSAFNSENCDIMVSWTGNSASPFNIRSKIVNTGTCSSSPGAGYKVQMESDGDLTFYVTDGTNSDTITSTEATYDDSKWHHFYAIKNGTSSISMYIDGKKVAEDTSLSTTGSLVNSGALYMGIGPDGATEEFAGFLDDMKIYRYARTESQLKTDMVRGAAQRGSSTVLGNASNDFLNKNLVGYWKMDESAANTCAGGTNDTCDSSENRNDMAWDGSAPTSAVGKFGNGVDFESSSSQYMSTADTTSLSLTGSFAVSTWIKLETVQNSGIFSKDAGGSNRSFYFSIQDSKLRLLMSQDGSNVIYRDSATTLTTGTWYHVAGVYNSAEQTLNVYLNGALDNGTLTGTVPSSLYDGNATVRIGYSPSNGYLDGVLDETRIYSRALTPKEIADLYQYSAGPVLYWKLDENTGTTIYDSSTGGHSGSLGTGASAPSWTSGKFGNGLSFDGTNDYAIITDRSALDLTSAATFNFWFYLNTLPTGNDGRFIDKWTGTGEQRSYQIYPTTAGKVSVDISSLGTAASSVTFDSSDTIIAKKWYHVSVTYDGTTARMYLNGVLQTNTGTVSGIYSSSADLSIGGDNNGSLYFTNGIMDDVKIYNYVRSTSQIIEDMNAGHPIGGSPVGSQVVYYKFDEGYGSTINNSGNIGIGFTGMMGTGTSAPTWSNDGKFGKALSFDGTVDTVRMSVLALDEQFTISHWIKTTSSASQMYTIGNASSGDGYRFGLTSGKVSFLVGDSGGNSEGTCGTQTVNDNQWHHIAGVYNNAQTTFTCYIDGKLAGTVTTVDFADMQSSVAPAIGNPPCCTDFVGSLDEIKIYNTALTANQIQVDYNQGKAIKLGTVSTGIGGTNPDDSSSREYCVPGDTSSCSAPIAEWNFNEGTGTTAYDSSASENTGTLNNFPASPWMQGKYGSAILFDGTDDDVTVGSDNSLNLTTFTMSAWIYPYSNGEGGIGTIINRGNQTPNGYDIGITGNDLFIYKASCGTLTFNNSDAITLNKWNHVVLTSNGTTITGYVNGIAYTTTHSCALATSSATATYIGSYDGNTETFHGLIDSLRMYNYVRTPAQIAWEYNRGAPIAWYRFDECQGTTAYNSALNGNGQAAGMNGTITIGATGSNTSAGTCIGASTQAWKNGATGKINSSLSFDGTDDYVSVTHNAALLPPEFSLASWIKLDTLPSTRSVAPKIVMKQHASSPWLSYEMYLETNDRTYFGISNSNPTPTYYYARSPALSTGTWYHVVGTYNNNTLNMYLNGALTETTITAGTMFSSTNVLMIGANSASTSQFDGNIDDIRLFNYALTPVQVKDVYNNGAASFR